MECLRLKLGSCAGCPILEQIINAAKTEGARSAIDRISLTACPPGEKPPESQVNQGANGGSNWGGVRLHS